MKNPELAKKLARNGSGITAEELLCGKFDKLVDNGLRIVTLCYDGSGRSATVANKMNELEVPSVRLVGGISQFVDGRQHIERIPFVQAIMNRCPNITVILTPQEIVNNYSFFLTLRASKYINSSLAIESLIRREFS